MVFQVDLTPVYQAMITVIIGVSVYVLGQVIVKFFIEPVNLLSQTIGEVLDTLIYYSYIYTNPVTGPIVKSEVEDRQRAQDALRQQATLLLSKDSRVRWRRVSSFLKIIPSKENVKKAHSELIFLSNSCFKCDPKKTYESSERIVKFLS